MLFSIKHTRTLAQRFTHLIVKLDAAVTSSKLLMNKGILMMMTETCALCGHDGIVSQHLYSAATQCPNQWRFHGMQFERPGEKRVGLISRLSRPPAAICAKPASRPQKLRLSRKLAKKNIRLSRREYCGLNTKTSIRPTKVFSILKLCDNRQALLRHPLSALLCFLCAYVGYETHLI